MWRAADGVDVGVRQVAGSMVAWFSGVTLWRGSSTWSVARRSLRWVLVLWALVCTAASNAKCADVARAWSVAVSCACVALKAVVASECG